MVGRLVFRWWMLAAVIGVVGLGCNLTGGEETPTAVTAPAVTAELPEAAATEVEPAGPTATAAVVAPTATLPEDGTPERPTPTLEAESVETTTAVTATVTLTPIIEPVVAAPGTIGPGQQTSGSVESGGAQVFAFPGTEFEPVMVFVEGDDGLDIGLSAYEGTVAAEADFSQLTALAAADFSPVGRPEVLVITPNENGEHTVVVRGSGGTAGTFTLYMYNGTTPAAHTRLESDSLAAGETKSYKALSNGGRPVIVFVDQTGQSDMVLQILDDAGELIAEANFGGPNSAETAFVLPLEETAYTILVSTAGGESAVYNLVIVTLN